MTKRVHTKTLLSGAICLALSGGVALAQQGGMGAPPAGGQEMPPAEPAPAQEGGAGMGAETPAPMGPPDAGTEPGTPGAAGGGMTEPGTVEQGGALPPMGEPEAPAEPGGAQGPGMQPQEPMGGAGGAMGGDAGGAVGGGAAAGPPPAELVGLVVVDAADQEVGEVSQLVQDTGGAYYAVVEGGGFLGIGGQQAVVPVTELQAQGEQARLNQQLGDEGLKALPQYEEGQYQPVPTEEGAGGGGAGGGMGGGM